MNAAGCTSGAVGRRPDLLEQGIGPRDLSLRGRSYAEPPAFAMRLSRIQTEITSRLGMAPKAPMPIALAASPDCGRGDFGLADVRI